MKALINPVEGQLYEIVDVANTVYDVAPPLYWISCPSDVMAGHWKYDNILSNFKLPIIVDSVSLTVNQVPESVSRFQARASLYQAGLLDLIDEYMALPTTPRIQKMAWEDAIEFRRDSPTVAALAQVLELTSDQVDNLFIYATHMKA